MVSFQYITLQVEGNRLDEIVSWYTSHLGLCELWASSSFVMLGSQGGARIGFHAGVPLSEPDLVQLHFQVEDVDKAYQRLRSVGLSFRDEPRNYDWGYRMTRLSDPAGHTVELYTDISNRDDATSS